MSDLDIDDNGALWWNNDQAVHRYNGVHSTVGGYNFNRFAASPTQQAVYATIGGGPFASCNPSNTSRVCGLGSTKRRGYSAGKKPSPGPEPVSLKADRPL